MNINSKDFRSYLISKNLCEASIKLHLYRFRRLPGIELSKLKKFINDKGKTVVSSTLNQWIITIIHIGHFIGADWKKEFVKRKEERKTRPVFSVEESIKFLDIEPNNKYSILFLILFHTGARVMEVAKLCKKDICLETNEIIFPKTKTGGERIVRIPKEIRARIYHYVECCKTNLLFVGKNNCTVVSHDSIALEFQKRLDMVGIERNLTPYSLRRTFITRNLKAGAPLFSVQAIVGHTNSNTTYKYFQCDNEAQDDVYKLDPLNRKSQPAVAIVGRIETSIMLQIKDDERFNITKIKQAVAMMYRAIC